MASLLEVRGRLAYQLVAPGVAVDRVVPVLVQSEGPGVPTQKPNSVGA